MKAAITLAGTIAFVLGSALPAFAQPAQDPAAGAEERARVHYEKGTKHYDVAEYDEAIVAFKDAYKELKEPLFLYNIAQAYRQKRDCVNAVKFYKTYLRGESEGATAEQARAFVAELEACAKEQEKAAGTGGGGTGTGDGGTGTGTGGGGTGTGGGGQGTGDGGTGGGGTGTGVGTGAGTGTGIGGVTTTVTVDRGKTKRLVGLSLVGVGGVAIVASVFKGMAAADAADELDSMCTTADPCTPDEWQAIDQRGKDLQGNQIVGIGIGTVTIAAGVGVYLWGRSSRAETTTVTVIPARGGAAVTAGFRF
jgi:hypothetical protein